MVPRQKRQAREVADSAPLSLQVSRRLRQAIVSGQLALGAELPSEGELTAELGVSRSTVREALRMLQAQGLVAATAAKSTKRPRVSTVEVVSLAAAQALENVVRLTDVPLSDLVELRVIIEGAAVEAAAKNRGAALADARAALATMSVPGLEIDEFRAADLQFHRALARSAGNAAFSLVMGVLRSAISSHLGEALRRERDPQATMHQLALEHRDILAAVSAGQGAQAKALVMRHISAFYRSEGAP